MELSDFDHKEGSVERVVYLSNSSASTNRIAPQSNPLSEEGKEHLQKHISDVCFLISASVLSLTFDSPVTLIFTLVSNLLPFELIVSTTGKFTHNIKRPSNILSCRRPVLRVTGYIPY